MLVYVLDVENVLMACWRAGLNDGLNVGWRVRIVVDSCWSMCWRMCWRMRPSWRVKEVVVTNDSLS
jgi:hypothetical protein